MATASCISGLRISTGPVKRVAVASWRRQNRFVASFPGKEASPEVLGPALIWLAQQGWREVTYRPDRRRYLEIPHAFVTELIDAGPDDRPQILEAAKAEATYRPQPGARRPATTSRE